MFYKFPCISLPRMVPVNLSFATGPISESFVFLPSVELSFAVAVNDNR